MKFLDTLKEHIRQYYDLSHSRGCFISIFGKNKKLISSHGVLFTDKTLEKVVDMIYLGLLQKNENRVKEVVCDIVISADQVNSMKTIESLDLDKYGLSISTQDFTKSGVILPGTKGLGSINQALQVIKEKNNIHGNVVVYYFSTKKITFTVED